MNRADHIRLMADYNEWMNTRLYDATKPLSDEQIATDNKAFFGSILGTLNHLVVADTIWLKRFLNHPAAWPQIEPIRDAMLPTALDQVLYTDIRSLRERRDTLDTMIRRWTEVITESDLDHVLDYRSIKGIPARRSFYGLLIHFFNHQTHHRGQATTLLSQYGIDVGITDLVMRVPDQIQT